MDKTELIHYSQSLLSLDALSIIAAEFIGFVGIAIMLYGAIRGIIFFTSCVLYNRTKELPRVRLDLGKHLALGLEFLVGKDIIETIVEPTWEDLGKLAAIIAIRTVVTVFLAWELKEVKEELEEEFHIGRMLRMDRGKLQKSAVARRTIKHR